MNLSEATVVVTGASAGIGAAAARQLHAAGAHVVVVGRNPDKTAAVARDVGGEPLTVDYSSLADVRRLAGDLLERCPRIDVLANNAGGTWSGRPMTGDGFSMTFQVNHLAPYLLTRLLHDRLVESAATIVQTSSIGHLGGRLDPVNPDVGGGIRAYGNAKLANILFTRELQRRWGPEGIRAAAFHPGAVATEFGRNSLLGRILYAPPFNRAMRDADGGADTLVWLAGNDDWPAGEYFVDRKVGKASPAARRDDLARGLWDRSAEMVGLEP